MEDATPAYLHLLHGLSAAGRATRSGVETERQLAICRACPHWTDGCRLLDAHSFARFLADATASCPALSG